MTGIRFRWALLGAAAAMLLCSAPCGAAQAYGANGNATAYSMERIKVTARKVEEDLQDVSASVSAFSGAELEDLGVNGLADLPLLVPGLGVQRFGAHNMEFNYRGIGGVTTMSKTWNINVDGVTVPYVGLDTFFDVERIEVLRGGQGALYGRNTHGGVINIVTRQPGDVKEGEVSASYSSFNTRRISGALGGPAGQTTSYRLAVQHRASDGYMENSLTGDDGTDWSDQLSLRGTVRYAPDDVTSLTCALTADTYSSANDGWANVLGGPSLTSTSGNRGTDNGGLVSGRATLTHDLGDMELTSIAAFSNSRYKLDLDYDLSAASMLDLRYRENFQTFTEELRLASTDADARLRWLTGVFFLAERTNYHTGFNTMGVWSYSDAVVDSLGGAWFGQASYDILPSLELSVGLRLDAERRTFDWQAVGGAATVDDGETWFAPLPSATLTYELAPGHKVYGSVSRGYRVGDFTANEVGAATIGKGYTVDPEFTLTSELGYKGEAAGGRLRFSTAVYHIDWDDMQVNAVVGGQQLRQNAGKAHSDGVEGEVAWAAAPGLDLFATASWMRAVFDEYENHPTGDPTGKRIPNTNECTVGAGGTYHHASGFFVAADATWFGEKYLDELNNIKQDPYLLGNARVGYKADGWSVAVFGRNLGDVRYLVRAYEIMAGVNAGVVGEPMSFGVEGLYTF